MVSSVAVLGSTGSIGRQTLSVAAHLGVPVRVLAAKSSVDLLEAQAREFRPALAVLADEAAAEELRHRLRDTDITVKGGQEALIEAAAGTDAELVITAVSGMIGLRPTLAAIREKKRIGLANKETLVSAGELVMREAERCGAEIVPVDSEHSAIFQCLMGCHDRSEIRRLILTASGGPFYGKTFAELESITPSDALRHPTWQMGPKITVDSATMMNKGLEIIEAMRLYHLPLSQVQPIIHRGSIVHSLVEYRDGAILAQLGVPDMRIPIQLAFTYPYRTESPAADLDLLSCGPIEFLPPDEENFPCLSLAKQAAAAGGTVCTIMNAANEVAVHRFLSGEIGFNDIPRLVKAAIQKIPAVKTPTLDEILSADAQARAVTAEAAAASL